MYPYIHYDYDLRDGVCERLFPVYRGPRPPPPPFPIPWKPVRWLADAVAMHEAAREAASAAYAGGVGAGGGPGSSAGYEMVATPGTVVGAGTVVAGAVGPSARGVLETAGQQQNQNQNQNQTRVYSEAERVRTPPPCPMVI